MIRDAHIRAARVNPSYGEFAVYRQKTDDTTGRPVANHLELVETCLGRVKWQDLDTFDRTLGGDVGEGQAALLTDWGATPAALRDTSGQWYVVKSALGADTLGVFSVYLIRRWSGEQPTVTPAV